MKMKVKSIVSNLDNIGNTVSPDPLYRDLVTLLDWSLSRLAPNRLITVSILF